MYRRCYNLLYIAFKSLFVILAKEFFWFCISITFDSHLNMSHIVEYSVLFVFCIHLTSFVVHDFFSQKYFGPSWFCLNFLINEIDQERPLTTHQNERICWEVMHVTYLRHIWNPNHPVERKWNNLIEDRSNGQSSWFSEEDIEMVNQCMKIAVVIRETQVQTIYWNSHFIGCLLSKEKREVSLNLVWTKRPWGWSIKRTAWKPET